MKDSILSIIQSHPRHYTVLIKKNTEMMEWIYNNTLAGNTDHLPTLIYSAINQVSNVCEYGNLKKISRFNEGLVGCGPSATCRCTNNRISEKSQEMHDNMSLDAKKAMSAKRQATMIQTYGFPFNLQREDVRKTLRRPKVSPDVYDKLSDIEWMNTEYNTKKRSSVDIAEELGAYYGTVIEYCKHHEFKIRKRSSYSLMEVQFSNFLTGIGLDHITSDWDILENKELDIYIPSHNLAIEIDGLYWHSYNPSSKKEEKEDKNKHYNKTMNCLDQGIELLHITDWQWDNKRDIIKSIIKTKIGLNEKIHARKCKIMSLTSSDARIFFENNHLDGFIGAKYHIGLMHNDILVMAISVGKARFDKKSNSTSLELIRLCSLQDTSVVGGGAKLLSYIKRLTNLPIISYCDRNISNGNGYRAMGFEYLYDTDLDYFWTDGNKIISRYKTQKHLLSDFLGDKYNPLLTEKANMFNAGYRIFWGCGNMVFKLK